MSIDTANSKEVMADSHIMEQRTFKFRGFVQHKLLNVTSYKPHIDDLSQICDLDSLDKFNDWTILSKGNNVTNKGANTPVTDIVNQEHQDYCNRQDQQYIGHKYDSGLEQIILELVPNIILKEEEDRFYQWAN